MTVSTLKKNLVLQAIHTLREINKKHYEDSTKKKPLLEEEGKSLLFIQVMLKKIPKSKLIKMIKVHLPHSLMTDSEVCLITGDLDKNNRKAGIEPDVLHYKTLLEKHGISQISQVMTLRQLRTEYKPYEAKQKLLAAYDQFLADSKIIECLPNVLGRHFFGKRKLPIQINLQSPNLKEQIDKALSTKKIYITGKGNSCSSEVAYLDMADAEIVENVLAMAKALYENVPGSWNNIMGIYLKTAKSKAIPVYVSYESPNDIQLPEEKRDDDIIMDELSTIPDIKVKVHSSGRVETVYVKDEEETSLTGVQGSDAEESSIDSELPHVKKEYCDMEKFETKSAIQIKSKKDESQKKKNIKQESVSSNFSLETSNKKLKLKKETKPVKQEKKNTEKKPLFPDQSAQKMTSNEENRKVALKRKRVKSESTIQDSQQAIDDNETPVKPTKKRKIDGVNMKKFEAMKELKKSKRKNRQKNKKQRI